jgi:hypothetical protein
MIWDGVERRAPSDEIILCWSRHADIVAPDIRTNLTQISPLTYSTSLPADSPPRMQNLPYNEIHHRSDAVKPSSSIIWSWSTLINIIMLYLLLSLGQQLQRLHSQVAFISEENKDLRTHTARLQDELGQYGQYGWERRGGGRARSGGTVYLEHGELDRNNHGDTSIGKVVLGQNGWSWEKWIRHPTYVLSVDLGSLVTHSLMLHRVTTLGRSLGWLWQTVVWLVHA